MIQPSSQSKGRTITGIPTPADLLDAHSMLAHHYPRTPLYFSAALSRQSGCEVFVKYENHGPVRSFKARGALYRLSLLSTDERRRGVVAASTGNHGQGIAYAARVLGISATVVVPDGTPELKTDAIESHDCELRIIGGDLAESNEEAQTIAAREGKLFVEDGNDGGLMAGAASIAWEVLEELPDVSAFVVPVGGGNLIAAIALVTKCINPEVRVIGVQSEAAPAVHDSWKRGTVVEAPCSTFAGGLATSYPGELAFEVIRDGVDEIHLVSEADLRRGIVAALETTGQVIEGAGAAGFAALEKHSSDWRGMKVALVLSGGNFPLDALARLLTEAGLR